MHEQLDHDLIQWLLPCLRWGGCAALLIITVLPARSAMRRWRLPRTHEAAGQWQTNKRRRDHSGGCSQANMLPHEFALSAIGMNVDMTQAIEDSETPTLSPTDSSPLLSCFPAEATVEEAELCAADALCRDAGSLWHVGMPAPPPSDPSFKAHAMSENACRDRQCQSRAPYEISRRIILPVLDSSYQHYMDMPPQQQGMDVALEASMAVQAAQHPSETMELEGAVQIWDSPLVDLALQKSLNWGRTIQGTSSIQAGWKGPSPPRLTSSSTLDRQLEGAAQTYGSGLTDNARYASSYLGNYLPHSSIQAEYMQASLSKSIPGIPSSSGTELNDLLCSTVHGLDEELREKHSGALSVQNSSPQYSHSPQGRIPKDLPAEIPAEILGLHSSEPSGPVYKELLQEQIFATEAKDTPGGEDCKLQTPGQGSTGVLVGSVHGVNFELAVHSDYGRPCHPQSCDCDLCSKQGTVLVANGRPLTVEGRFSPGPPQGSEVQVTLQYVVVHKSTDDCVIDETCHDVWVLKQLGVIAEAAFCVEVPAKQLVSSYHGINATRKAVCKSQAAVGTFHTHLRAEVTCIGAQKAQSFRVYSPEVYVSGDRNFRRISHQE